MHKFKKLVVLYYEAGCFMQHASNLMTFVVLAGPIRVGFGLTMSFFVSLMTFLSSMRESRYVVHAEATMCYLPYWKTRRDVKGNKVIGDCTHKI